jgi:spermidine/putrescine transport system ATP-binding protein
MSSSAAVEIDGLRKEFGDVTALDGVSFDVQDGEFFTLVGPSGCGKTTLLRILAGLERETEGTVFINGQDMTGTPAENRPTSMVFQNLALFPYKSVYANLAFGLKMDGVPKAERRERADEMLSVLDLEGYGEKSTDELSGGEQQRIALGRSLLTEPDILLLDEPLSSLDVQLRKEMQIELRRIHRDLDSTFFYVTHDQEVALTASDRIGVMRDGELVQRGTPQEVYEQPNSPFVARFIGKTNIWRGEVASVTDDVVEVTTDDGLRIRTTTDDPARGDAMQNGEVYVQVRPERVTVGEEARDMENVFEARVEDRIYQGDDILYEVRVGETSLQVQQPSKERTVLYDVDSSVNVGWSRAASYLIRDGGR